VFSPYIWLQIGYCTQTNHTHKKEKIYKKRKQIIQKIMQPLPMELFPTHSMLFLFESNIVYKQISAQQQSINQCQRTFGNQHCSTTHSNLHSLKIPHPQIDSLHLQKRTMAEIHSSTHNLANTYFATNTEHILSMEQMMAYPHPIHFDQALVVA